MTPESLYGPLKGLALLVLLLLVLALIFVGVMSVTHWSGIGV